MKSRTQAEWVQEYQNSSALRLQFFLESARALLKSDLSMLEECMPDALAYWQGCIQQGRLEISVLEERLALLDNAESSTGELT